MKIAYFCEPQVGGTYSFFKRIRPYLQELNVDLRCIPPYSGELFIGTAFEDAEGVDFVRFPSNDLATASQILIAHLLREGYEAVMILPGSDLICVNLVRYLPHQIRAMARVPMFTRGSYAPTIAIDPWLDVIIAVSRRIMEDLTRNYGLDPGKLRVIYNGVNIEQNRHRDVPDKLFRILFTGRLVDSHKGIFILPDILARILNRGVPAHLYIVGDGPDGEKLRNRFNQLDLTPHVSMIGNVPLNEVTQHLHMADCYILPSRYEGCPNSLLEAMAAGCACVATHLKGCTDDIIEDGISGLLAEMDNVSSFSSAIEKLVSDPEMCTRMGEEARRRIEARFEIHQVAARYAEAFHSLKQLPDQRKNPESIDRYNIPRGMQPTWRTLIPEPIKNALRRWADRAGIST